MVELSKKFSINDVAIDRNAEDKDFAIAEIWALSEGTNSHRNPFSREVLERDAHTFKGKFIIGKYDEYVGDTKSHEIKEDIYGYVSVTEEPQFKTKIVEGIEKEFVVVKALISKIYAKEIVDMFNVDNKRSVSCEFSCALQYDEDEYGRPIGENGNAMDIDNPVLGYSISGITILGKKIKPSVKEADMVMKRFSEDSNKLEIESKGDNMKANKEFSEQPKDEDIVMQEPNQQEVDDTKDAKGDDKVDEVKGEEKELAEETDSAKEEEKEMSCGTVEEKEMGCGEDKEMSCKENEDKEEPKPNEEEKEMSCGEDDSEKEMSCGENKELSCEDKEMSEQEEKSFSEKCVEFADEDHKEFVEKLFSCELKDMVEQVVELKKFMEATVKADTEKRFSEIMVEPKLCLGEKAYNVLFEEGSKLTLSELDAFEVKVKAFCEDSPKKQEKSEDELLKFACGDTNNYINTELSVDELIKKYN